MKKYPGRYLSIIIIIAVAALIFIWPFPKPVGLNNFSKNNGPWRLGLDLVGGTHLVYDVDMSQVAAGDRDSVMNGLKDVIEKRVNLFGVSEPQVVTANQGGNYRLIVDLAGVKNISSALNEIGATPFLDFRLVSGTGTSTQYIPTGITGRYLTSATMDFDQTTGLPFLSLTFNGDGAKLFENMTAQNVGKVLCTFIDNQPTDCATIQEKIPGGHARITGNFTTDQVQAMAARFNAGALPAPIKLNSQQTIGASLGQESLKKAVFAGIIGTLAVLLFMLLYYRRFGIYADMALIIYIILTAAIFKLFVTMSLAGIAGYILSIGMAVDANILIFERTKEEIKKGLSKAAAVEEGFRRAWPSIRDSNSSTLITAAILYFFTSSFVKGFALTLGIGVLVSMFSAITITRLLMRVFSSKSDVNSLATH